MNQKLTFNKETKQWIIGDKSLRDFYMEERAKSKRSIVSVEQEAGLYHMNLTDIEKNIAKTPNPMAGVLIRALETLGYSIEIVKH